MFTLYQRLLVPLALSLPAFALPASDGSSGCSPEWLPTFGGQPGVDGTVYAVAAFDDGSGPAFYAGGEFATAGGVLVNNVVRWDGASWSALGVGLDAGVRALVVFDDGGGPALYAGGFFHDAGEVAAPFVARWDGVSWSPLPGSTSLSGGVFALAFFDDGGGPALYAGGPFGAGDAALNRVAKWDGTTWLPLGVGLGGGGPDGPIVLALAAFDDGGGEALYAAGHFGTAGGAAVSHVARWDGASWSDVGGGMSGGGLYGSTVHALAVFDDGAGPALHAGGLFLDAGGVPANGIARWDGASWSALGPGLGTVHALTAFDDGGGSDLYAGGSFFGAGSVGADRIARWDGASWSTVGSGMNEPVFALGVLDDGGGAELIAGGGFTSAGGVAANRIAAWDGAAWSAFGGGLSSTVTALAISADGGGPALYAGGWFQSAGGVAANRVARWDGASWSALGGGIDDGSVYTLAIFDDGGGPALFAGGTFTSASGVAVNHVARWDGTSWSALAGGVGDATAYVHTLAVHDDGGGPALYAGGNFTTAGAVAASGIARWDGAAWSAVGSGIDLTSPHFGVRAFARFDDGGGPALFAAGYFLAAGGVAVNHVARWDGSTWSALGGGVAGGSLETLAVFDDGGGPALYAGGYVSSAGGVPVANVARWDGASWSSLGTGTNEQVQTLTVFDDGGGPALFVGGHFTAAGGVATSAIARWDGAGWSPLGSGVNGWVRALAVRDDVLYVGGSFASALDSGDSFLAAWGCPPAIQVVPGCHGNVATLSTSATEAPLGQPLDLVLQTAAVVAGSASLYGGFDGTDAAGCGLELAGLGELLLGLVPTPFPIAHAPLAAGSATFSPVVPNQPALIGVTLHVQAAGVGSGVELSNALAIRFGG